MTSKRDHQFPSTSIGRSQGARLHQVDSHDSLAAHPLLTSNRPSSPLSDQPTNGLPRYVPYTPRQRVTPTAATASPQQQQGDAMSKLQLINMKAAAQNLGLDTGSVGWAILEKLISEADAQAPEWAEIWAVVTSGKATLLLPLEEAPSNQSLMPEFVKDHIIFYDGPVWKNTRIVTLSGLRGILDNDTLTFRSSIHPSSKLFQDIVDPITRTAALSRLPDLPLPLSSSPQSSSYPMFTLPSHTSSLPIPPRAPHTLPAKPPLPPRPAYRAVSAPITSLAPSSTPPPSSRLSNPFAGLFGSSSNSSTPKALSVSTLIPPPSVPALASPTASPSASLLSVDSNAQTNQPDYTVIEVSAFTISRKIVRNDVGKEMNKALRREVQDSLTGVPLPTWVIDCVHQFTAQWYPVKNIEPVLGFEPGKKTGARSTDKGLDSGGSDTCVINRVAEKPEDVAVRMQDFYLGLEQDVRIRGPSFWEVGEEHEKESNDEQGENEKNEDERRVREKINSETRIKEVMEVVERTICSLFYDRLYLQPMSDDASHDETLSSRVAALNMLDLGLEHLDIHVGEAGPKLDLVVRACGETLTQLDACRCPGDKAAVLVAAHKILVDGLSRLPPIRLMSDEESKAQKAKASSVIEKKVDAPPRDIEGKLRIMTPMVSHTQSQALEVQSPEAGLEILVRKEGEGDLKTARRASLVTVVTEPASDDPPLEPGPGSDGHISQLRPSGLPSSSPVASPVLELPTETTPISGDVLLPMIIFSVVKTNPPRLVSNLLYTQRFRNHAVGGEESYCLINLMAVAEFLENVDLAALGLGDSDKVMSAADLTPIPLDRSPRVPETAHAAADGIPGSLRGRVEQANKVLTDVVDSSFGMLRSLLPHSNPNNASATSTPGAPLSVDRTGNTVKPGFGLLRRESGFSIKSITAALPMPMGRGIKSGEETGQQLITVSKPGSFQSSREEDGSGVEESEEDEGEDEDEDEEDEEEDADESGASAFGDTRSIRSFESMLSGKGMTKKPKKSGGTRKSLSDRLAHMSGLSGFKGSPQTAALPQPLSPASSMRPRLKPPIQRFLDSTPDDLRLGEVGELLRDYQRLVEGIRAVGGFEA